MSDIPRARELLLELARDGIMPNDIRQRIRRIVRQHMVRKSPVRRSPQVSDEITPAVAQTIRAFARANPSMSMHKVAEHFNVNPGRVSEVLTGKR